MPRPKVTAPAPRPPRVPEPEAPPALLIRHDYHPDAVCMHFGRPLRYEQPVSPGPFHYQAHPQSPSHPRFHEPTRYQEQPGFQEGMRRQPLLQLSMLRSEDNPQAWTPPGASLAPFPTLSTLIGRPRGFLSPSLCPMLPPYMSPYGYPQFVMTPPSTSAFPSHGSSGGDFAAYFSRLAHDAGSSAASAPVRRRSSPILAPIPASTPTPTSPPAPGRPGASPTDEQRNRRQSPP